MPTGLKIPVGVDETGGAAIEREETAQNKKIMTLGLSEGGDKNAFQNLGLRGDIIFDLKNVGLRGKALDAVQNFFAKYPDRYALKPDTPVTFKQDTEGEVEIFFEYIDLLTNEVNEFRRKAVR